MRSTSRRGTSSPRPTRPASSRSSRRATTNGSSPATSQSPAGSSMKPRLSGVPVLAQQAGAAGPRSTASTTAAPGCSSTSRRNVSSPMAGPGRRRARSAITQSSRNRSSDPARTGHGRRGVREGRRRSCSDATVTTMTTVTSLTRPEAETAARRSLITSPATTSTIDLTGLLEGERVGGHVDRHVHLHRAGGRHVRRRSRARSAAPRSTVSMLDLDDRRRRPAPADGAGRRQHPGGRAVPGRHGRGPPASCAPSTRPTAGLRVDLARVRRRAAVVGLLRPARPEGAAPVHRDRARGVDGDQQHAPRRR